MKVFRFKLYIAGSSPNSIQALRNLTLTCEKHLDGRFEIEVIDVVEEPQRALSDRVFLTPTLLKISPSPVLQIVGKLSDQNQILKMLDVEIL